MFSMTKCKCCVSCQSCKCSKVWNRLLNLSQYLHPTSRYGRMIHLMTMLLGLFTGVLIGYVSYDYLSGSHISKEERNKTKIYARFLGKLFINILNCITLPILIANSILGIAALPLKAVKWVTIISIIYVLVSTLMSCFLAAIFSTFIYSPNIECAKYDEIMNNSLTNPTRSQSVTLLDTMADFLINLFPDNIVRSTFEMKSTGLLNPNQTDEQAKSYNIPNLPGLLFICACVGVGLNVLDVRAKPLLNLLEVVRELCMWCLHKLLWIYPLGIAASIAGVIAITDDLGGNFYCLRAYISTVMVGLLLVLLLQMLLLLVVAHKSPLRYLLKSCSILIFAAGTSSSTATLPYILMQYEDLTHAEKQVMRFYLPCVTPVNKHGTAFVLTVIAVLFRLKKETPVTFVDVLTYCLSATIYSYAAGSVQGGSIMMMKSTLITLDLPTELADVVLPVDWFLDRCRTVTNIFGNLVGLEIVTKLCRPRLASENLKQLVVDAAKTFVPLSRNQTEAHLDKVAQLCEEKSREENEKHLSLPNQLNVCPEKQKMPSLPSGLNCTDGVIDQRPVFILHSPTSKAEWGLTNDQMFYLNGTDDPNQEIIL